MRGSPADIRLYYRLSYLSDFPPSPYMCTSTLPAVPSGKYVRTLPYVCHNLPPLASYPGALTLFVHTWNKLGNETTFPPPSHTLTPFSVGLSL